MNFHPLNLHLSSGLARSAAVRSIVAVGAAGLLAVGSFSSVYAAGPSTAAAAAGHRFCIPEWTAAVATPGIDKLRAAGDCEINRRFVTLDALTRLVNGSDVLTADHKIDLRDVNAINPASYAAERAGLTTLKASIDSDTTLAALRADVGKIAPDYRVYLLVVPKTHLVAASDATAKAIARFGPLSSELQNLINLAKAAGKDVTAAQAALDDLKAKVAQAGTVNESVAASILPLSPSDWNNGTAKPLLTAARSSIHQARGLLVDARQDAHKVIVLLGS
jgi:hypothetical protein